MLRILPLAVLIVFPALAQAQAQIQPGQWQIQVDVTSFDMPNAPPQVAEAFKKPITSGRCVTPAEAASGPLEMMREKQDCRITRQSIADGKFDAVMVCDPPGNGTMTATLSGTFSATRFAMNAQIVRTGQHPMKMTTATSAERVGDCQ